MMEQLKKLDPSALKNQDWKREDVNDIFHWSKQIQAVVFGLLAGLSGLTGWQVFVTVALVFIMITSQYAKKLNIPDDVLEFHEWYTEGTMPAFVTFVLFWIVTYTFIYTSSSCGGVAA